MFVFLFAFVRSDAYIDIIGYVEGNWMIDEQIVNMDLMKHEKGVISNNLIMNATRNTKQTILHASISSDNTNKVFSIDFSSKWAFKVIDNDSNTKLADFQFEQKLLPHLTSVGKWKNDGIYVAKFISKTSMHLTIIDQVSNSTHSYIFTKDVDRTPPSFIEKNLMAILSVSVIVLHTLTKNIKQRKIETRKKQMSEKETQEFLKTLECAKEDENEEEQIEEVSDEERSNIDEKKDTKHFHNDY